MKENKSLKSINFVSVVLIITMILTVSLLSACSTKPSQDTTDPKDSISSIVKEFGSKLQIVSLQAPKATLEKSMKESYHNLVSQALIEKWIKDPLNAPGRLTSSPWPDRIEILSIKKLQEDRYKVKAEIIEITSVEKENGGVAAKRPITLFLSRTGSDWLIDDVTLGAYEETGLISYKNTQYGFDFSLPNSWKDYTVINSQWKGMSIGDAQGEKVVETGTTLSIRHPKWSSQNQRQDIPIMIFTLTQWNSLQQENFHIGAAPVGPSELGRNSKYVFALPARYNFAFPTGFEEVQNILNGNPLKPTEQFEKSL